MRWYGVLLDEAGEVVRGSEQGPYAAADLAAYVAEHTGWRQV